MKNIRHVKLHERFFVVDIQMFLKLRNGWLKNIWGILNVLLYATAVKTFLFKSAFDVLYVRVHKEYPWIWCALVFQICIWESIKCIKARFIGVCSLLLPPPLFPFIHCLFSVSPWFPRTDWRKWWGAICFSWRMLLTQRHSGDNHPPTHTHTYMSTNACWTVNSQPTLSHYTWKLTIIPYMAFPASPFFPLVAGEARSSFHNLHLRCP